MKNIYVGKNVVLEGKLDFQDNCSVWHNAVLRADTASISIGRNVNIQDLVMIHAGENVPVVLEDNVTVGHACILHGCTVRNTSIIGMGSILMNHSCIGSHCIVGAGSLVTENKVFPDCSLIMGRPARWIRSLTQEEIQKCEENARHYLLLAKQELEQREM